MTCAPIWPFRHQLPFVCERLDGPSTSKWHIVSALSVWPTNVDWAGSRLLFDFGIYLWGASTRVALFVFKLLRTSQKPLSSAFYVPDLNRLHGMWCWGQSSGGFVIRVLSGMEPYRVHAFCVILPLLFRHLKGCVNVEGSSQGCLPRRSFEKLAAVCTGLAW